MITCSLFRKQWVISLEQFPAHSNHSIEWFCNYTPNTSVLLFLLAVCLLAWFLQFQVSEVIEKTPTTPQLNTSAMYAWFVDQADMCLETCRSTESPVAFWAEQTIGSLFCCWWVRHGCKDILEIAGGWNCFWGSRRKFRGRDLVKIQPLFRFKSWPKTLACSYHRIRTMNNVNGLVLDNILSLTLDPYNALSTHKDTTANSPLDSNSSS